MASQIAERIRRWLVQNGWPMPLFCLIAPAPHSALAPIPNTDQFPPNEWLS